jgi:hypothetical protein
MAILGVALVGVLATIASGEFLVSWGFLAIGIPGTALAASCSYRLVRAALERWAT